MNIDYSNPLTTVPIVQSDSILDPPLKAIIVSGPGSLVVKNNVGNTVTIVFPEVEEGGSFPFVLPGMVTAVLAATTIADANLTGLR